MRRLALLAFVVLATLTMAFTLWELSRALIVLLLSLAVAAAFAPVVDFWTARGVPRALALGLAYGLGILILTVAVLMLTGSLLADLQGSADELAIAYKSAKEQWPHGNSLERAVAARLPTADLMGALGDESPKGFAQVLVGLAAHLLGTFGELVVILMLSVFWSASSQGFERLWLSLVPVDQRAPAREAWEAIQIGVGEQVRNDLVQSLLVTVLLLAGFHAMGVAHPTLPAVAAGLLRLVPLVGVLLAVLTTVVSGFAASPELSVLAGVYTLAVLVLLELLIAPALLRSRTYSALLVTLMVVALTNGPASPGCSWLPRRRRPRRSSSRSSSASSSPRPWRRSSSPRSASE